MIAHPLPSLERWTQTLLRSELPALRRSIMEIADLKELEEHTGQLDAYTLSQSVAQDPLMTLKLLAHVSHLCTARQAAPPETVTAALIMLGIGPFFRTFEQVTPAESLLSAYPQALQGLQRVIQRSSRASLFAANFAMQRQDEDVLVIQEAALLHDAGELLLWCHAPELMGQVATRLAADHTLKAAHMQQAVLGIEANDLTQALMREWELSPLLRQCTDDKHAEHPQVRNVMLAVRLARHTQDGWSSPKAEATRPADMQDVADLLNISVEAAERKMHELDN